MRCLSPVSISAKKSGVGISYEVPCGKCAACLRNRQREWTCRLMHELRSTSYAHFITLTYDDDHIPPAGPSGAHPLNHRDIQLFLKRLRKSIDYPIKFVCVGEYGEDYGRPHYHLLLFNYHPPDLYKALSGLWDKGIFYVGDVNSRSCMYTFKYCFKLHDDEYDRLSIPQPYMKCSTRPAIGSDYLNSTYNQYYVKGLLDSEMPVLHEGFQYYKIPRFYRKKLDPHDYTGRPFAKRRFLQDLQDKQAQNREELIKKYGGPAAFAKYEELRKKQLEKRITQSFKNNQL